VVQRRVTPLIVLVVVGLGVLVARLFQIQVLEHRVWAGEAANLVRSGLVVPFERGAILDAKGRELAHDRRAFGVEFCYRDFRRSNPLGAVVHARSALFARPVSYAEALGVLGSAARELAVLSPRGLSMFARGLGLDLGNGVAVSPSSDPEQDQCAARAADVRFYVQSLLGFTLEDRRALRRELSDEREIASYVDFLAERRRETREELLAELDRRVEEAVRDLEKLAGLLALEGEARAGRAESGTALAGLFGELETWRAEVEDEVASELFARAAGFPIGRIDARTVDAGLDLTWLARVVCWDEARLSQWIERERATWLASVHDWSVPAAQAEMQLVPADERRAEALIGELVALFAPRDDVVRERRRALNGDGALAAEKFDRWLVLSDLDTLVEAACDDDFEEARAQLFPFDAATGDGDPWQRVATLELALVGGEAADPTAIQRRAGEWYAHAIERWSSEWIAPRIEAMVLACDALLQREIARELDRLFACAEPDELGVSGKLAWRAGRISLAGEQVAYVQKDRGNRPFEVERAPPYELVETLSRHRERFAGFSVRARQERVREVDAAQGRVAADGLVGSLGEPGMLELRRQRRDVHEMSLLLRQGSRSAEESERLAELLARIDRPGEKRGTSGLESYFDAELSGHNGYRESRGLQELAERDAGRDDFDLEASDGQDLVLTLDLDLQRAAESVLAHPVGDPNPDQRDDAWLARPVGAIVIATVDGDVLAAASVPLEDRGEAETRGLKDVAVDRTLRLFDHQPPGSVFKPFVAAFALDYMGLDRNATVTCRAEAGDSANYKGLHCASSQGHGVVDLGDALEMSCNCYFAWLGEQFDSASAVKCLQTFGFGSPTGVKPFGVRSGWREDSWPQCAKLEFRDHRQRLSFGNGLSVVQSTPMQVTRALCGLATGALPAMRMVSEIGGESVPKTSEPLAITAATREFVRRSMVRVATGARGSAHASLDPNALGFTLAVKTGSGDYRPLPKGSSAEGSNKVRKHTWVGGWIPAEDPRIVFVVFEFDTLATASHGAAWLTRELLTREEVRAWLAPPPPIEEKTE
jgi:penicillin-binding protein 2